jgi:hypothetical protein
MIEQVHGHTVVTGEWLWSSGVVRRWEQCINKSKASAKHEHPQLNEGVAARSLSRGPNERFALVVPPW